jgi:hypothetical protein
VIEVQASAAILETTSTALVGVVDTKTVADLPMNGRDFRQMIKLAPGRFARQHLRQRNAHQRQQLPDRRRRQQRRVSECRSGESGRRCRHRGHAPADRGHRPVCVQSNASAESGRNAGSSVNW